MTEPKFILTKMTMTTLATSDVRIKGRPDSGPPLVIFLNP